MTNHSFALFMIWLAMAVSCSRLGEIRDGVERMSPPPALTAPAQPDAE